MSATGRPLMMSGWRQLLVPTLLRLLAAVFLVSSVQHWGAFFGSPGVDLFQNMPVHAQIATLVFAVTKPFVAVGLWLLASWGVVLWVIVAIAEMTLHLWYGPLFVDPLALALFHGATMALYVALAWWTRPAPDIH